MNREPWKAFRETHRDTKSYNCRALLRYSCTTELDTPFNSKLRRLPAKISIGKNCLVSAVQGIYYTLVVVDIVSADPGAVSENENISRYVYLKSHTVNLKTIVEVRTLILVSDLLMLFIFPFLCILSIVVQNWKRLDISNKFE